MASSGRIPCPAAQVRVVLLSIVLHVKLTWRPDEGKPVSPPKDANKPILVYGAGASSGQYTVQLLHVAGYTNVLATASPAHHAHLKALGAKEVFDYRSPTLAQDVEKFVGNKVQVIVDCIATETTLKAIGPALADDGFFAILLPIKGGDKVRPEGAKEEVKFYCEWEFSSDFG